MMRNKYKMICFSILFLLLFIVVSFLFLGKEVVGAMIDRTGITEDSYTIHIGDDVFRNVFIYWMGEDGFGEYNKMLIFHKSLQSEIPASYGANRLIIKYGNHEYNKIGIWKKYPYSKYNYFIDIDKIDSLIVINWRISNWYDPGITQSSDTIKIE